ncbi:MAG TPA: addiction module protein [Acidobacteriota bacterium]
MTIERALVLVYASSMQSPVDLKQMTLPDKLQLMEALWDELCSREEEIPVPDWHKAVLDEREQQIKEGKATFIDWETAKQRIGKRIS